MVAVIRNGGHGVLQTESRSVSATFRQHGDGRGQQDGGRYGSVDIVVVLHPLVVAPVETHLNRGQKFITNRVIEIQAGIVALKLCVLDDTLVIVVVERGKKPSLRVTTRQTQAIGLDRIGIEDEVLPIAIGHGIQIATEERHIPETVALFHVIDVGRTVHHIDGFDGGVPTVGGIEVDFRFAGLTFFSGNEHHPIGCTRTVDGGRRGILEHFDTFDVIRVDVR